MCHVDVVVPRGFAQPGFFFCYSLLIIPLPPTDSYFHCSSISTIYSPYRSLCRIYVVVAYGFAEPGFFLTALFLVLGSLRDDPSAPRQRWNYKVVAYTLLLTIPIVACQLVVILFNPLWQPSAEDIVFTGPGGNRTVSKAQSPDHVLIPPILTKCAEPDGNRPGTAACYFPLLGTVVLGAFAMIYLVFYVWTCLRMGTVIINKRLHNRLHFLMWTFLLGLPTHVLLLAFTVFSHPNDPLFESLLFASFFVLLCCFFIGEWILIVRPIHEGIIVAKSLDRTMRMLRAPDEGKGLVLVMSSDRPGRASTGGFLGAGRGPKTAKVAAGVTPPPQAPRGSKGYAQKTGYIKQGQGAQIDEGEGDSPVDVLGRQPSNFSLI